MARKEVVAYQLRLDGTEKPLSRFVYEPGEFARLREQTEVAHCDHCDTVIAGRRIRYQEIYYPFDDTPAHTYTYCEPCSDAGYDQSEQSFWCEGCGREIWESKGHRLNYKLVGGCSMVCVRCFQEDALERGHDDDEIEDGTIPCDWYDHSELRAAGWEEGEEFSGSMLERSGGEEWRIYCREIKAKGGIVLTDQGRTSIIGGPDYVTVWFKMVEQEEKAT
jgi:hypothetical protein